MSEKAPQSAGVSKGVFAGRTSRAALLVSAVAALLRLAWVTVIAREPKGVGDPLFYLLFARGIASGRGYVSASGHPTAYYPPGYPYFLGVVHWVLDRFDAASLMVPATLVIQALMGAATAGMVVVLTRRVAEPLIGDDSAYRTGLVAGVIMALWPNLIAQSGLVLSETLFLFLFVMMLVSLTTIVAGAGDTATPMRQLAIGAALFGLCVVVRPQSTLLVLPVVVIVLIVCRWERREVLKITAAFSLALLIVLTPWTIRNAIRLDSFVPLTTNTGDNLCIGFNPDANGGFLYNEYCITDAMYLDGTAAEVEQNRDKTAKALQWAVQNASTLPRLSVTKMWITMENDVDALWGLQSFGHDVFIADRTFWAMKLGANTYYRIVLGLAIAGTIFTLSRIRRTRARPPMFGIVLALIPAGLVVPVLSFGDPRFKAPLIPSIAILAAVAVVAVTDRFRHSEPVPPDDENAISGFNSSVADVEETFSGSTPDSASTLP